MRTSWIDRHGPVIAVGIAFMGGLVGLFNRSLGFHDEIINTNKAIEGVVLDYAMRPVFYGLNALALQFFGNHTYALVMLSLVSLILTALLLYHICTRYFSSRVGLLCVVAFIGISMVRSFGVRAMPNGHAGMFMLVSLCLALACFDAQLPCRQRILGFAAGLMAIISFATHPTMAGYLVALCSWAGLTWLLSLSSRTKESSLARPLRQTLWIAIGVVTGIGTLMLIYALWYHQSYFSAWWHFASIPQGSEAERGISLFCVRTLLWKGALPAFLLVSSLLIVAARRFAPSTKGEETARTKQSFVLAMVLYCLVVGMAMISLNQWKHQRIIYSYVPLLALSFACWSAAAKEVLALWLPQKWLRVIVVVVVALVMARTVLGIRRTTRHESQRVAALRDKYLSLYETLRNVPDPTVGFLVGRGELGTKATFVHAAGLQYAKLAFTDELATMTTQELRATLQQHRVRYLYWDLESTSRKEYEEIASNLRSIGGGMLLNWRGLREVWFVHYTVDTFYKSLRALPAGTKVGIFGEATELSDKIGVDIRLILERHRLSAYVLNVNRRSSRRQLYYLTRNEVDYILLPSKADHRVSQAAIAAMKVTLLDVGGVLLETGGSPELQLWKIPDRARAAAKAER